MKTMAISEFKSHALQVLGEVAACKERVVVTKRGKPIAAVVPYTEMRPRSGRLADALVFEKDLVGPLDDERWDACQ